MPAERACARAGGWSRWHGHSRLHGIHRGCRCALGSAAVQTDYRSSFRTADGPGRCHELAIAGVRQPVRQL